MSSNDQSRYKQLRFQQLQGFSEAVRRRSFSAAAAVLGISRPAVWQQMRALERELGTRLVKVRGRTVEPTDDGKLLLELAAPLVAGFESLRTAFNTRRDALERGLTVVTTASLLVNELKDPVRRYRGLHPGVHVTLIDRPSQQALELLENDRAELALVGDLGDARADSWMEREPLGEYPFTLILPADHPLVRKRTIGLAELIEHPLVLSGPGTGSRRRVDRVFEGGGLLDRLNIAVDSTNGTVIQDYVEMGLGIGVTSLSPRIPPRPGLRFKSISHLFGVERVVLVRKRGRYEPPHVAAFRQLLREMLAQSAAEEQA